MIDIMQKLALVNFFFMTSSIQYIASKFPKETDLTIQDNIVPKWRLEVRKWFDKIIDERAFYRRYLTISLPDNLFISTYYMLKIRNECMLPRPLTPFEIGFLACGFLVAASGVDAIRKMVFYSLAGVNVPLKYIYYIAPRDCIIWSN